MYWNLGVSMIIKDFDQSKTPKRCVIVRECPETSGNICTCIGSRPIYIFTPAIRIRQRPGHPGSPDVLSANGSLHFGRYSEACNGRVERFLCQVQVYFRSYWSGFYHYVLAFSNDLPTLYIARPMTKRHFAGD